MHPEAADTRYAEAISATLSLLASASVQPAPADQTAHLEALLRLQSCINLLESARAAIAEQLLASGMDLWSTGTPPARVASVN
jgi:hypothetical protein